MSMLMVIGVGTRGVGGWGAADPKILLYLTVIKLIINMSLILSIYY